MRDERVLESELMRMGGELGLHRTLATLAEMAPPWLERLPLLAWLPKDLVGRLEQGASALVAGAPLALLSGFQAVRVQRLERDRPAARAFDVAFVLHRVLAAADPVALLALVRHGLKPDGACLVVEHVHPPEMTDEARVLARALDLVVALRGLTAPPEEDLHRVPLPESCPAPERLARLARAAGFGRVEQLPIEEPLMLFRLER